MNDAPQIKSLNIFERWTIWAPFFLSVLRITAALIFMQSGTMKLFAFPMGIPPNGGTVDMWSQAWWGGILELWGGAFILVGLFTRPVAFLLAGEMAVAYFQFHAPQNFWPVINGGNSALLYSFVWLYISSAGAGPWSLDAFLLKRRRR